jgi:hypothetical protein
MRVMPLMQQVPAPPPAAATPVSQDAVPAYSDLTVQLQQTVEHMSALRAELKVVQHQVHSFSPSVRSVAAARLGPLTGDLARTKMELSRLEADIAGQVGRNATTAPPQRPPGPMGFIDGDNLTGIIIVFILAGVLPISLGITRRLWRGAPRRDAVQPQTPVADSQRLERLEQAMDAIAIEIERISEGQRFVTKVLADRPVRGAGDGQQAGGEQGSLRALGVGAIEPVRVAERQAVRQSVTPH